MYDNNTLYYLNQLGIVPWVLRDEVNKKSLFARLDNAIRNCEQCNAHQPVFFQGHLDAALMVISDQVLSGKGQTLFYNMLRSIGLSEKNIYFSNIIQCSVHGAEQIKALNPDMILVFGALASEKTASIQTCPVMTSHHPEVLLKNPVLKKQAYADFQSIALNVHVE